MNFPLWIDNSSFSVTQTFLSTFGQTLPLSSTNPFTPWLVHCSNWVLNGQFISAVATSPEPRGARNKCICSLSTSVYPSVWSPNTTAQLITCSFSFNLLQNWSCWLRMCFNANPQEQHTSTQALRINVPQQKPSRTKFFNTDTREQHPSKQTLKNNASQPQHKPLRPWYTHNEVLFGSSLGDKTKFKICDHRYTLSEHSTMPTLLRAEFRWICYYGPHAFLSITK